MTLYYRGRGLLAFVIPVAFILIATFIKNDSFFPVIAGMLGGIIVYFLGLKLNNNSNSEKPNLESLNGNIARHSLFWINMEIWGLFFILIGFTALFSNYINETLDEILQVLLIFSLAFFAFRNRRKEKKILKNLKADLINKAEENQNRKKLIRKKNTTSIVNKTPTSNKMTATQKANLSKSEARKRNFYDNMKANRSSEDSFGSSNHENYLPK